ERDGYQCRNCGGTVNLNVHHIVPLGRGGGTHLENLVTICRSCHEGVHPHLRNFGGYHPRIAKPVSGSITLLFLSLYFAVLGAFMRWSIDSLPYPELTPRNPLPEFLFWGGMLGI